MCKMAQLPTRKGSINRTGANKTAEDLVETMLELDKKNLCPQLVIKSEDIIRCNKILEPCEKGQEGSNARFTGMEEAWGNVTSQLDYITNQLRAITQENHQLKQRVEAIEGVRNTQNGRQYRGSNNTQDVTATRQEDRQYRGRSNNTQDVTTTSQGMPTSNEDQVSIVVTEGTTTFAEICSQKLGPGTRDRSSSSKRHRSDSEEEWETQPKRKNKKKRGQKVTTPDVREGTAQLSGSDMDDLTGPIRYWVGGTNTNVTEEQIKGALKKTTQTLGFTNFEILEVKCLNKRFDDNGEEREYHSKSWQIQVPYKCREAMETSQIFPGGWKHRRWEENRKRGGGGGGGEWRWEGGGVRGSRGTGRGRGSGGRGLDGRINP